MDLTSSLLLALLSAGTLLQVWASDSVPALYGETVVVPCNDGAQPPTDLMFIKWKYEKDDGTPGDLLIRQAHSKQATIQATDNYAQRISTDDNYSLLISKATLDDQKTFTCMVVSDTNLMEYTSTVVVSKKPTSVQILDQPEALQKDKPTTLGTCVAAEANPAALITWKRNGEPLEADGKAVVITSSLKVDPATRLSTTSSILQYTPTKDDINAVFTCVSTQEQSSQDTEMGPFPVHYPSEKVDLQILSTGPIEEGDNVTMKCLADGNPPPNSFFFYVKGQKVLVENSDTYTLTSIDREAAGEYKCSLIDDEEMEDVKSIFVDYLDLNLSPTGNIVKMIGDPLTVKMETSSSREANVTWTKDGELVEKPTFSMLAYADTGLYACKVSVGTLSRSQSFKLTVEGKPTITSLKKQRADDKNYKVLTCEAEGVPEPSFQWSVNGTDEESSYVDGKATHKISVIPKVNLSVTCTVTNKLGVDFKTINVSSIFQEKNEQRESEEDSGDQAKLIVGVVAGLLIAAAVVGLFYWLYVKNSRQGSWKTGEKENGTPEESKKLEESNHTV